MIEEPHYSSVCKSYLYVQVPVCILNTYSSTPILSHIYMYVHVCTYMCIRTYTHTEYAYTCIRHMHT